MLKKPLDAFKKLNKRQRIEFIAASVLTAVFISSVPAYAWFANSKNLETMTKIKEPGEIIIRSGKSQGASEPDAIVNFELSGINIAQIANGTPQMYVFSVTPGENNPRYDLQIAHTTNIPLKYELYHASEAVTSGMTDSQIADLVEYHPRGDDTLLSYYSKGTEITLNPLNSDTAEGQDPPYGRPIAIKDDSNGYYAQTYETSDDPEIYAVPVYLQTSPITHTEGTADDYFILQLKWDGTENAATGEDMFQEWNAAKNNKETDIIYITAHKHLD